MIHVRLLAARVSTTPRAAATVRVRFGVAEDDAGAVGVAEQRRVSAGRGERKGTDGQMLCVFVKRSARDGNPVLAAGFCAGHLPALITTDEEPEDPQGREDRRAGSDGPPPDSPRQRPRRSTSIILFHAAAWKNRTLSSLPLLLYMAAFSSSLPSPAM